MSAPAKTKKKYFPPKKQRGGGPPRGGDGTGDFKGGPMSAYREQPLPEMLSAPGISITTVQGKEMAAEREIMAALEDAADELYPDTGASKAADDAADEDGDIEDMLKKELEGLADASGGGGGSGGGGKSRRFRICKRATPCVVYIVVLAPLDPVRLVTHVLAQCERTARCALRYVQRLVPISATGTGNLTTLAALAAQVLPDGLRTADGGAVKFAIQANARNSHKLERLEMIKTVAEEVTKLNPEHKVDLSRPDRTILVELFKTMIGVSVVSDFERFKRFNPARVAKEAASAQGGGIGAGGEAEAEASAPAAPALPAPVPKGASNMANRERRGAAIAEAQAASASASAAAAAPKRKASEELEDGQVRKADDCESGEVVEDERAQLGDDYEEVIEGGRAVKVRKTE